MAKTDQIGIRITPEMRRQLEAAAAAEGRSVSNIVTHILANWLKRNGGKK